MKKKCWLTALLAGCSLCASHAQTVLRTDTNDLREIRLDEVVVTGTGTEHYLKDAPVQTEVITGKALEQYNGRSLDEILSALSPSITFSPGDMGSNIQLNGLKNDYILIMVNGKRMNGDIGGQKRPEYHQPGNHRTHRDCKRSLLFLVWKRCYRGCHQHHHEKEPR